jgi:hypothetical protein
MIKNMKYYLDTEFIEYPCTIDLISIGIVSEDNRRLYLISSEFDKWKASQWVRDNVICKLEDVPRFSRAEIKEKILEFVGNDKPEFWGYYCDYDWVALCWLMGTMMDLPKGWPMYCNDLKQLCMSLGNPRMPKQESGEHNALADAEWVKNTHKWLEDYEVGLSSQV